MNSVVLFCLFLLHVSMNVCESHNEYDKDVDRQMRLTEEKIKLIRMIAAVRKKKELIRDLVSLIKAGRKEIQDLKRLQDRLNIEKTKHHVINKQTEILSRKSDFIGKQISEQKCFLPYQLKLSSVDAVTTTSTPSFSDGTSTSSFIDVTPSASSTFLTSSTEPTFSPYTEELDGCFVVANNKRARGSPSYGGKSTLQTYSCYNQSAANLKREIHVLASYKNKNSHPAKASLTSVLMEGNTTKPITLVLSTYEPVTWHVEVPPRLHLESIYMFVHFLNETSVSVAGQMFVNPEIIPGENIFGYGNDNDGGDTLRLLRRVQNTVGYVTSLSGTYQVDRWVLKVGD